MGFVFASFYECMSAIAEREAESFREGIQNIGSLVAEGIVVVGGILKMEGLLQVARVDGSP